MKRTILAMALLCACAGYANAQSSVTVYGVLDEFVEAGHNGNASIKRVQSGGIFGSRLGFRGQEQIDADLRAFFVMEQGLNADDGTLGQGGLAWGRQIFVGLDSKRVGALTVGRQITPVFYSEIAFGLGGGMAWGNAAEYFSDFSTLRADNSILYSAPYIAGFTFKGMVALGERNDPASKNTGNLASVVGQYDLGPWSVGASYLTRKTTATNNDKYWYAGTSYKFMGMQAAILYQNRKDDANLNRNDFFEVSATFPLPQSQILVDYGRFRNKLIPNGDAQALSLRYDYYLSKRTTLYVGAGKIVNEAAASFTLTGATSAGLAVRPGGDPRSLIFGMRHTF